MPSCLCKGQIRYIERSLSDPLTDFVFILPRGELQKTRRKLAHMQSVAQRLRDQAAWFQSKAPNLSLPGQLQSMPLGALAGYT